ncbi:MAG: hypothetical protein IJJ67_05225 [Oscillospiraceae bacterium]|nr:hypothetical protein [Oscillospiraceae bacterium]
MGVVIHRPPIKAENFVVPVPKAEYIPRTDISVPFNAADRQTDPMNLSLSGYCEEEYFLSGTCNVYSFGPQRGDTTYIKVENAPYKDRILVRKPIDPNNFSGTILVEMMNNAFFMDNPEAGWGALYPYLLSRGDAWVGLSVKDDAINALKKYDPARYSTLSLANPIPKEMRGEIKQAYHFKVDPECENGLIYDIMSQTAALFRSDSDESPFSEYDVRFLYATGATAGDMTAYAGFVHNYSRQPNGKTIYDGLQIFMTGSPNTLNNEEKNIVVPNPLCFIDSIAPCFRLNTLGDMLGAGAHPDYAAAQRRDDQDDPVYRVYETSGAGLGIRRDIAIMENREDAEKAGGRWLDQKPKLPYHAFPMQMILRACFDNLKKYCEKKILPPVADKLEFSGSYPDMQFVLDEFGNVKGGIRSSFVDVPIAEYIWDGTIIPFSKEKLRTLYKTHTNYVFLVAKACERQVEARFLLPEDALAIIKQSLEFNIDDDAFMDSVTSEIGEDTYGMLTTSTNGQK